MENLTRIRDYFEKSISAKRRLIDDLQCVMNVAKVADLIVNAFECDRRLFLAGNGGSAGDSQHIAAEFVSRFMFDRPGLPAIALTTDTSALTAIGNDYGFERLFERQLQALARPGDVFIGITTSGASPNVINALKYARRNNILTVVLCGEGGDARNIADLAICVPSVETPFIQESHICIGHIICGLVEEGMFRAGGENV